nr:PREDICTED: uncharacterized protein LOC109040399 isoform X2 [Bemisia tabaci]XP_018911878.1 PREDICTED: uncharacterized protein LOC109040399 isoform X2 [Bemisia tabaci]XP_018911880.1 PREDICTED: uncharacterized protein LOC109040399 isoform X2 [Bemisia tabaci]XP_018911881.1 PREDICTED: uncharacterized protein LOC109040399 isoform X2 [Bemisia tabaci]
MIAALVCSIALIFASIEGSPTTSPQSKSYDELLDALIALESDRESVLKKVVAEAANQKSNETGKVLKFIGEADKVLVKLRHYFEAGKIMLDLHKGKSKIQPADLIIKTQPLREEDYLQNQMLRLSATLRTLDAQVLDIPTETLTKLLPAIAAIRQSEQALAPIATKFKSDATKLQKTAMQ